MDKPEKSSSSEKHPGEPLAGKRVVVTRAPEQSQELIDALENLGAEVLLMPTVSFAPPEDSTELDAAMKNKKDFDWILFTSQNAVRFVFLRACELSHVQPVQALRPKVAGCGLGYGAGCQELGFARGLRGANADRRIAGCGIARSDAGEARATAAQRSRGRSACPMLCAKPARR